MDPTDRLVTPATRRTIVRTGAKLAYAAPLVAVSLTLGAANAAAAVSLGSLCEAGSVFFSRVVFSDDVGGIFESPACCTCGSAPACSASTPVDPGGSGNLECTGVVGEGDEAEEVPCFARCGHVP